MSPLRQIAWLAVALAAACASPVTLSKDFVVLAGHRDPWDYRAVTGDDARLWLRRFADPNDGDLAFWARSLEYDFVQQRGYDLVAQGETKDADGAVGRWFQCNTNVRGERVGYLVAVWVDGAAITVVEFAARADVFEARVEAIKQALHTVNA